MPAHQAGSKRQEIPLGAGGGEHFFGVYPDAIADQRQFSRAGCLAFSRSSSEAPMELSSREFSLSELPTAAKAVESDQPVDPELLKALHPGTGGARPKCNKQCSIAR